MSLKLLILLFSSLQMLSPAAFGGNHYQKLEDLFPSGTYRLIRGEGKFAEHCPTDSDPMVWREVGETIHLQITPSLLVGGEPSRFLVKSGNLIKIKGFGNRIFSIRKNGRKNFQLLLFQEGIEKMNCSLGFVKKLEESLPE